MPGRESSAMPELPERTPEEREAARLARERRRRGGEAPSAPAVTRTEAPPPYEPPNTPPRPAETEPPDDERFAFENGHEPEIASGTRRVGWHERVAAVAPSRSAERAALGRRRRPTLVRVAAVLA